MSSQLPLFGMIRALVDEKSVPAFTVVIKMHAPLTSSKRHRLEYFLTEGLVHSTATIINPDRVNIDLKIVIIAQY